MTMQSSARFLQVSNIRVKGLFDNLRSHILSQNQTTASLSSDAPEVNSEVAADVKPNTEETKPHQDMKPDYEAESGDLKEESPEVWRDRLAATIHLKSTNEAKSLAAI